MAVIYDYVHMQNRIVDELWGRSDLSSAAANMDVSPIKLAIQTAIKRFERERFYFNELRTATAFSTVIAQEFYTSSDAAFIATLAHIDKMSIVSGGNRLYLEPRTAAYIEDMSMNASNTGLPMDYSYYGEKIRFYPIPDAVYAVNALYTQRFAELSGDTDTNSWMSDAEGLIRSEAKRILYVHELKDPEGAAAMANEVAGYYRDLKGETMRRVATTKTRPTYF